MSIAATFLPWLASGAIQRNSYQLSGLAARLGLTGSGPSQAVLNFWPVLGPLLLVPVLAGVLRWWRTMGVASVVLGVFTAGFGIVVIVLGGDRRTTGVRVVLTGPVVLAVGVAMLVIGGVMLLIASNRTKMERRLSPTRPA